MKNYYIYLALLLLLACKDNRQAPVRETPRGFIPHTKEVVEQTYHQDTTCKYEHRTGKSGDYQYNYDVSGSDGKSGKVTGNITVEGKYGEGILTDEEGNKIKVTTEWVGYGKLKATDSNGNEYKLDVD